MNSGQLRVGKGYIMVTVGQQGELKENITELHIIVRTTGILHTKEMVYQVFSTSMVSGTIIAVPAVMEGHRLE